MTTVARQAEADRVEAVYYWAVQQLGAAAATDAQALYEREVARTPNPASTGWLRAVLRMLFGFRGPGQELATSYYRLQRALRTGTTYSFDGEDGTVSLERLRSDFEDIVDHIDVQTGDGDGTLPPRNLSVVDDEEIPLEAGPDIKQIIEELDNASQAEAVNQLDQLGVTNLLNDLEQGRDPDEAYTTARDRQAAAAMRITMNAARGLTYNLADTDAKIQGWIRYSTTGTPCGWCAMLLSRGLTDKSGLYATRETAQGKGKNAPSVKSGKAEVGEKFHDNCHCVAVPIFLTAQISSPLFELNREYAQLWISQVAGTKWTKLREKPTDTQLTVWRRLIREKSSTESQAAQEAA